MSTRSIDHEGTELSFPKATVRIWIPAPAVFVGQFQGHLPIEMLDPLIVQMNRVVKAGSKAYVFYEASAVTSYEPRCRTDLVRYFSEHRPHLARFAILVRSKLMAMGATVANLALGGFIDSFADERKFEDALDQALASGGASIAAAALFGKRGARSAR